MTSSYVLLTFLLVTIFTRFTFGNELRGISISQSHFCVLAKGKIKCFDSHGEVQLPGTFLYPNASYGGGNNHCVRDYNGVHCWNWSKRKLVDYPDFFESEELKVSKGYVCGKKDG